MKTGNACKNLTDGLLILAAVCALIGFVFMWVSFDGEAHLMNHPTTGEEIMVEKATDNPYIFTYLILTAAFSVGAIIGFASHKFPPIAICASIALIVISMNYFTARTIKSLDFLYVLIAVTSLAGNVVYTCYYYAEVIGEKKKNLQKSKTKKSKV